MHTTGSVSGAHFGAGFVLPVSCGCSAGNDVTARFCVLVARGSSRSSAHKTAAFTITARTTPPLPVHRFYNEKNGQPLLHRL